MRIVVLSKYLFILIVLGVVTSCRPTQTDPSIVRLPKYKESIREAYGKMGFFSQSNMIPGITVAVSINNEIVWADGFGYSNYELKTKALPIHKFRIGQVSQFITAITAAKLAEEGKLQIDKPVAELYPEMSKKPFDFTIRQLGANSAGIRQENTPAGKGNGTNIQSLVSSFIDDDFVYEPGTSLLTTELGFDLMGFLIEKNTQIPFMKTVKKTVIDTLHLSGTCTDSPFQIIDNKSTNYDFDFVAQPILAKPIDLRGKEASAGYLSTALDLVKLGNTVLFPGFLKQESIDLLTKPFKLNSGQESQYAFGLIVTKDMMGRYFLGLSGAVTGGSAALVIFPEDKMVISVTANVKNDSWELPVFDIAEVFLKHLHPDLYSKNQEENPQSSTNSDTTQTK